MRVIVTGATRGIGRAITEKFHAEGNEVCGIYVSSEYEASIMRNKGIRMEKVDVSDKKAVKNFAESFGYCEILVNNAGISLKNLFQCVSDDEEQKLYAINLFGTLNMTRSFLPGMINNKYGVIINVSSVFGEIGGSMEVDYSASKAAVIGLTKALAKEIGPSCVRVNCVAPGIIDTDMNANLSIDDVRNLTDEIPLESLGTPNDVAEAVAFLASEKAKYITGTVLSINGGWF